MALRSIPTRKLLLAAAPASVLSKTKQITQFGRNGELAKAWKVFDQMPVKNQVTWNAMLSALLAAGRINSALHLFDGMPHKNPTSYTSMIAGLSRSGLINRARMLFDSIPSHDRNVFSWTAMISCYAHNAAPLEAMHLFSGLYGDFYELNMLPNAYTFSILLKSCCALRSLAAARQVQSLMVKLVDERSERSVFVNNALIDVNAKLGSLVDAEALFARMEWKDLVSYNTMMDGYTHHLMIDEALGIFYSMKEHDALSWNIVTSGLLEMRRGEEALRLFISFSQLGRDVQPNPSTYTIILSACSTLTMLEFGRQIHARVARNGLYPFNIFVCNSLITLYASGGSTEDSEKVFDEMPRTDIVSWNSVIQGLGQNGHGRRALEIAERTLSSKSFNSNTFTAILSSCSHGGLVVEGLHYFTSMRANYGIEPCCDHYVCVADMLGRAGKLEEAYRLLREMPLATTSAAWGALLNACLIHNNSEIGQVAAKELQTLDPADARSYLALTNFCSRTDRIEGSGELSCLAKDLRKEPGCSWAVGT